MSNPDEDATRLIRAGLLIEVFDGIDIAIESDPTISGAALRDMLAAAFEGERLALILTTVQPRTAMKPTDFRYIVSVRGLDPIAGFADKDLADDYRDAWLKDALEPDEVYVVVTDQCEALRTRQRQVDALAELGRAARNDA